MEREYLLKNGRRLYYSAERCRFWLDTRPQWPEAEYMPTELYSLRIEISHACNGCCRYCIVFGNHVQDLGRLDMPAVWAWLNEQEWFAKIRDIFLIGGEPMLFFDDILFIADHFSGKISFSTNGTLITAENARALKERGVFVYLSLDGPDREDNVNRVYRDGRPMYDDILRGLEHLEAAGTDKGIFMVSTPQTAGRIASVMEALSHRYRILKFGYSLPHWTENESGIVTPEQYRDALCAIYENRRRIDATVLQIKWRTGCLSAGRAKRFSCALHTVQTTLLPDRSIVRCAKIDHDPVLREDGNRALDVGCPLAQARDAGSRCAGCVALGSCGGGCPYDGLRRFGTIIDRRECVITPPVVELAIRDVVRHFENDAAAPAGLVPAKTVRQIIG